MDAPAGQVEYLSSALLKQKKSVTYHTLARELKIHQNNAKNLLHEFYAANGDKILASFIITGKNNSGNLIKLCKDESSLELDMKLFESIHSIHVYNLQAKESHISYDNIVLEELKYEVDHTNSEEYYKLGMIRGPGLVVVDSKLVSAKAPTATTKTAAAQADSTTETSTKPVKSAGLTSGYVSRKAASNDTRSSDRSKTDSITNYTSRKSEATNKPSKRSLTAPTSGYQYKSRKLEKQQPRERVVISNEGDDEDHIEEVIPEKRENKKNLSNLNNLFIDDFSDESDQEPNNDEKEEPVIINEGEPASKVPEPKEAEAKEPEATSKKTPTPAPRTEPIKTEQDTVDEDGYLTSFKSNNPLKSKHDKKKTQSSLMNFFKPK